MNQNQFRSGFWDPVLIFPLHCCVCVAKLQSDTCPNFVITLGGGPGDSSAPCGGPAKQSRPSRAQLLPPRWERERKHSSPPAFQTICQCWLIHSEFDYVGRGKFPQGKGGGYWIAFVYLYVNTKQGPRLPVNKGPMAWDFHFSFTHALNEDWRQARSERDYHRRFVTSVFFFF